jgi:hypothetical protein
MDDITRTLWSLVLPHADLDPKLSLVCKTFHHYYSQSLIKERIVVKMIEEHTRIPNCFDLNTLKEKVNEITYL